MSDEQERARLKAIDDQMDRLLDIAKTESSFVPATLLGDCKNMKLTDLNPRWVGLPGPIYDGVSFDCPHCRKQRLAITFNPPIDPNGWWPRISPPTYSGINVWKRDGGETFETLTLSPSIDANVDIAGHWHGHIRNGQVT